MTALVVLLNTRNTPLVHAAIASLPRVKRARSSVDDYPLKKATLRVFQGSGEMDIGQKRTGRACRSSGGSKCPALSLWWRALKGSDQVPHLLLLIVTGFVIYS